MMPPIDLILLQRSQYSLYLSLYCELIINPKGRRSRTIFHVKLCPPDLILISFNTISISSLAICSSESDCFLPLLLSILQWNPLHLTMQPPRRQRRYVVMETRIDWGQNSLCLLYLDRLAQLLSNLCKQYFASFWPPFHKSKLI